MILQEPLTHGWIFIKECRCGGMYQQHFRKNGVILKVYPNNNLFKAHANGKVIQQGGIAELNTYTQSN